MAEDPTNYNSEYSLDEMRVLIKDYCEHRSKGYSKEAFVDCDYRTIERHLETYEANLQPEKRAIEKAERKNRLFWEGQGIENMFIEKDGGNFNSAVWIFNMKNRFNWKDKSDMTSGDNPFFAPIIDMPDDPPSE
jgi:hypothetical protein